MASDWEGWGIDSGDVSVGDTVSGGSLSTYTQCENALAVTTLGLLTTEVYGQ